MSCCCEVKNLETAFRAKYRRLFFLVFLIIFVSGFTSYTKNKKIEELEAAIQKLDNSVQTIKSKNSFSSE
jgi:outer membrane lipoprotein-sorting protein